MSLVSNFWKLHSEFRTLLLRRKEEKDEDDRDEKRRVKQ